MIRFQGVELRRGGRVLFADATFDLHPGWRIGLTGANGSGKSSLLALLMGRLEPDRGQVHRPQGWRIAHVAQETPALADSAREYVVAGDQELVAVEAELAVAGEDGERVAALHAELDAIDGYGARVRAAQLLTGLGFAPESHEQPVQAFSGGWRMRLNLARALMARSDLLLLDEPTNHLDLDAVVWLEQWLASYSGTLVLISHDRDFLDGVVGHVLHLEGAGATLHRGNYSSFEAYRAEQLALQQAQYEKQQRRVAELERFITRFRAKATKARQAQSRIKVLERMERVEAAHTSSPFEFSFPEPERVCDPLLKLEELAAGYGNRPVLEGIQLSLRPGDRIGLLGRNGAGKSTLTRLMAGDLPPVAGRREPGPALAVGYFAQHQMEQLVPDWTPVRHLLELAPRLGEQVARDFLGGFGFHGERALEPTAPFSGGEKARLALALIAFRRPNLLLLDEPTNHLDLQMRHALTLALQAYSGALVLVSHDRHLLRATCDRFLLVDGGGLAAFDGDLEDYRRWLAERQGGARETAGGVARERKAQKRAAAEARQQLSRQRRPLERRLEQVDRELEKLQAEAATLEAALSDPDLYQEQQKDRLTELLKRQGSVNSRLEDLEVDWLELSEALEALG